jgi:protein TonB
MKRYCCIVACGLLGSAAHGQAVADSAAVDSVGREVMPDERWVRSAVDSAGVCTEVMHWSGPSGLVRVYYASGQLRDYIPYGNLAEAQRHGVATTWYESGQLCVRQTFLQGRRDSTLLVYYKNGQLRRKSRYIADSELPGFCFDSAGAAVPYFPYEQPPLYPGGQLRLMQELSQLMSRKRPSELSFLSAGWYDINFLVNEDGSISTPAIAVDGKKALWVHALPEITSKQVLAELVEQERGVLVAHALDALAKLPTRFYPGKRDGAAVRWNYHLRIVFDYEVGRPRRRTYRENR